VTPSRRPLTFSLTTMPSRDLMTPDELRAHAAEQDRALRRMTLAGPVREAMLDAGLREHLWPLVSEALRDRFAPRGDGVAVYDAEGRATDQALEDFIAEHRQQHPAVYGRPRGDGAEARPRRTEAEILRHMHADPL
jgi:hypothetical protein